MTADQVVSLMDAIAHLIAVVVWPALLLFLALRFRAEIADFLRHLGNFSLRVPGLEASATRQTVQAAVALGAAEAAQAGPGGEPDLTAAADALTDARGRQGLQGRLVLWVDDDPGNNRYERDALEALGVRFALSTSTDEALDQLHRRRYDLVISDMSRPRDAKAGYTLLDAMRGEGDRTPYVIYAGARAPEYASEARRHGAVGATNSPRELIRLVTQALTSAPAR